MTIDYRAWPIGSVDLDDVPLEAMRFDHMIWQAMKRFGWYVTDRAHVEPDWIRHALRFAPVPPRTREDTGHDVWARTAAQPQGRAGTGWVTRQET